MKYSRRVRFGETDPFNVVYFTSYFHYFKEALDEFLRSKGFEPELFYKNSDEGYAFPIVRAEADFVAKASYDDVVDIDVTVENIGERSVTFSFKSNFVVGRIVCACIDRNWKSLKIPEKIRNKLMEQL
jgi:YbgC/YbaW family acyl-CoA thioester hydrolase